MKPGDPVAGATPNDDTATPEDGSAEPEEIHIAGVLVQCRPLDLMRVCRAVDALPAAEVFQSTADGRLVVVIEAPTSRAVIGVIDGIRALQGVVNVALVYQHAEPAADMRQEMEMSMQASMERTPGGWRPDDSEEHA